MSLPKISHLPLCLLGTALAGNSNIHTHTLQRLLKSHRRELFPFPGQAGINSFINLLTSSMRKKNSLNLFFLLLNLEVCSLLYLNICELKYPTDGSKMRTINGAFHEELSEASFWTLPLSCTQCQWLSLKACVFTWKYFPIIMRLGSLYLKHICSSK